ncbi:MAG: VRR-NUC domain-containing protein [Clostridia bacterium]|nr:VRR-NUC domain-containing protein [Clostridia bacterium]
MAQEKNFENKIKKYLKDNGCWYVKYFANRMTKSGVPDILACVNSYFVGIEVKASNGKPSELQIYHREEIRKAGGISIILYPEQFDDFKLLIDDLICRPKNVDWNYDQQLFDER